MHGLQAVRVEFSLLSTHFRIDGGLLRLHHRQRLAVISPQNVIGVTETRGIRHARDFVLTVMFSVERPAGTLQRQVDDQSTGFVLVPVTGLGDGLVFRLDGGEPFTQRLQLAFYLLSLVVGCVQLVLEGFQFFDTGRGVARCQCGDKGFVEGFPV